MSPSATGGGERRPAEHPETVHLKPVRCTHGVHDDFERNRTGFDTAAPTERLATVWE